MGVENEVERSVPAALIHPCHLYCFDMLSHLHNHSIIDKNEILRDIYVQDKLEVCFKTIYSGGKVREHL